MSEPTSAPQIGWWYTHCCVLDAAQIITAEQLADIIEQMADPDHPFPPRVWPTREALEREA